MIAKYQGRVVFVEDPSSVAVWLQGALGLQVARPDPGGDISVLAPVVAGDGNVEFYLHPTRARVPHQHLGTFVCADSDKQAHAALAMGCSLVREVEDTPWGTRDWHLVDPNGIEFTLSSPSVAPAEEDAVDR